MAAPLSIRSLRARLPADAQPVAARLALQALGADLEDALPAGLPPQALLWLRRLQLQAPEAALLRPAPPAWRRDWIAAGRERLDAALARAARPALGPVAANAEAVLFADEAEMLACLVLAARDGRLDRWWWRGLLGRAWPHWQAAWAARPQAQPAARRLVQRAGWDGVEAGDAGPLHLQAGEGAEPLVATSVPVIARQGLALERPGAEADAETGALADERRGAVGGLPMRVRVRPEGGATDGAWAGRVVRAGAAMAVDPGLPAAAAAKAPPTLPSAMLGGSTPDAAGGASELAAGSPHLPGSLPAVAQQQRAAPAAASSAGAGPEPADVSSRVGAGNARPAGAPAVLARSREALHPGRSEMPAPQPRSGGAAASASAPVAPTAAPHRSQAGQRHCDVEATAAEAAWPWPQALPSRQVPLLFVVNALLEDGFYPDFTRPRDPGLQVPLWALLAALASAWRLPNDPLRGVLAARGGDWAVPQAMPAVPGVEAGPWAAWLPALARVLRRRLCARLGLRAAQWPGALTLAQPARLWLSEAEWVAEIDLAGHDVAWRLAGLDRDPGWLPSAGCSLRFEFR